MRPAAVGTLVLMASLGAGGLSATPAPAFDAHRTTTAAASVLGHPINTRDKSAVREAYQQRFEDNFATPSGWIGDTDLCLPGTISQAAQDATLESVNFVRAMVGLDAVKFGDGLSSKAQEAAVMFDANNAINHDPPHSWDCWTPPADAAAGHSDLALTTGTMDAGEAVSLYMSEPGSNNKPVGHRRWILRPEARIFGNGMTDTVSVLWVIGPTRNRTNPRWVTWPSRGWFPAGLEPKGRWSISSGSDRARFTKATVTVRKKDGPRLDVHKYKPVLGYGKPTMAFHVSGLERIGTYVVTVRGITGTSRGRHTWTVKLFD